MRTWSLLIMLCLFSSVLFAAENFVPTEIKGQGATRDKAIQNGLYLAVCKVHGVAVHSTTTRADVRTGSLDVIRDPDTGTKKIDVEDISASTAGTLALTEARGLVKSFDIIEEKQISPDVYEVNLKVLVYDYQSPEDIKKLRLAIFPFEAVGAKLTVRQRDGGAPTQITWLASSQRVGEQFSQYLTTALARNEKFIVLDRDTQTAILKEKNILISPDSPLEEKARLGEVLGADYMLVGKVTQAEILVEEHFNPAIGAKARRFMAYLDTDYRLLVGPTRQVTASDQLRIKLEDQQVKALMEKWESDRIDYNEMEQNLIQRAVKQIADMVGDYLYPVRVAAVQENGMLILNQGGKRFAEGDILEVSRPGADIVDPETGKSLGAAQIQVATIKVTRILPRFSYAALMQGTASDTMIGNICRRVKTEEDTVMMTPRPSSVRESGSGGVRLPFDQRGGSQLMKDK